MFLYFATSIPLFRCSTTSLVRAAVAGQQGAIFAQGRWMQRNFGSQKELWALTTVIYVARMYLEITLSRWMFTNIRLPNNTKFPGWTLVSTHAGSCMRLSLDQGIGKFYILLNDISASIAGPLLIYNSCQLPSDSKPNLNHSPAFWGSLFSWGICIQMRSLALPVIGADARHDSSDIIRVTWNDGR